MVNFPVRLLLRSIRNLGPTLANQSLVFISRNGVLFPDCGLKALTSSVSQRLLVHPCSVPDAALLPSSDMRRSCSATIPPPFPRDSSGAFKPVVLIHLAQNSAWNNANVSTSRLPSCCPLAGEIENYKYLGGQPRFFCCYCLLASS